MKKTFIILFVVLILVVPAIVGAAQNQQGIHEAGTGTESIETQGKNQSTQTQTQNQGEATNLQQKQEIELENSESEQIDKNINQKSQAQNERALSRRSQVANAVQAMERVATNNQGIGDQVRIIAQNQNKIQEEAEKALKTTQKRGGFAKFLIGPNYGEIKTVEDRLENHVQNVNELKTLKEQIQDSPDAVLLDKQIQVMEEVTAELRGEVASEKRGFSLFGWLFRLLSR